jgi:hypothetical protein
VVIYHATSVTGCLHALVMTGHTLFELKCPILPYRGRYDLGDWTLKLLARHNDPDPEGGTS